MKATSIGSVTSVYAQELKHLVSELPDDQLVVVRMKDGDYDHIASFSFTDNFVAISDKKGNSSIVRIRDILGIDVDKNPIQK